VRDLDAVGRGRRAWTSALVGLALVAALTACSTGSGEATVALAQARVTAKEAELAAATSAAAAASAAFCTANQAYITALDRYGDVLNATAPTVGDVKSAGQELAAPRQETLDSAEAVMAAHQQVGVAEQELATARTSLALAQSQAQGTTPAPTPSPTSASTTTPAPLVPTATTKRVKQADAEFQAAMAGITAETPLVEAAQRFNASVVALEMSWLALFADAGCLADPQKQQAQTAVHDYTVALQSALGEAGYFHSAVDGVYGPSTVEAVEAVQKAHGLPVTGTVDKATAAALQSDLQAKGGAAALEAVASTAAVQQTLKLAGFWDGPVDGTWTPALTDAVKAFQTELGVPASGTVDAATVTALQESIAAAQAAATSTTAPPGPTSSTTTASATTSTSVR
jgi:peptidoglycan hydrolase-like protein with peptidoglycan-binding domain